jgi:nucleoside-diphosphate-sugar epimerase
MKKAIVSGANGFIGSVLVKHLTEKGVNVLALGRKSFNDISERVKTNIKKSIYLQIEMENIENLNNNLIDMNWDASKECVFFNLAWGGVKNLSDLDVAAQMKNVSQSVAALEVSKKIGCTRFLQIGTMEEAFTHRYLDLDFRKNNEYNRHVIYSVAKIAAKYALLVRSAEIGIDFIYILHSHVMGPGDSKDSFLQVTLEKLINGGKLIFSSGHQYFDVISPYDCANGYYLIGKKGVPRAEYWVGSGKPRPLRSYVEEMYNLYPSKEQMKFGDMPYNDIVLSPSDFSIENLVNDTGYSPSLTYEQIVHKLYKSIIKDGVGN